MSLSSFVDTIIVNNITNNNNNLNILDTVSINVRNDVEYGIDTKIVKNNIENNTKLYHIYKNNIISNNNIAPLKNIIDNYLYFFRNNYIYYLDKQKNRIISKRLVFKQCNNNILQENNYDIIYEEYLENVYYFNLSISCENCNYIYVNETNNFVLLLLPDLDYIVALDITNMSEHYISLPSEKNYTEIFVINDKNNALNLEYLYCKNDILNTIDMYKIDPDTFIIEFIKDIHFIHTIQKNIINNYNIFTLCDDNKLRINLNENNYINDVDDIIVGNYFIKNNNLQVILAHNMTCVKIQNYDLKFLEDYIYCYNNKNDKPIFILTNE